MDETLTCPTCSDQSSHMLPVLSIIIPAYNAESDLQACLQSLKNNIPVPFEILVINDASSDNTAQIAQSFETRLFSLPKRSGPASARNLGSHEARGQWIFFLDADVTVQPDTIANALAHRHL